MARDAYIWGATALIGGAAGALDAHAYAEIQDGDPCITPVKGDKVYHHIFDSSSSAAESSPDVIAPDDVGENPGRWILQEPSPATVAANTAKNTNVPIATDPIWTAAGELVIGTGANTAHRLAAGAITKMLVGGGAADPVWTETTGSGAPVRATSPTIATPTLTAPVLGTPASGNLSATIQAGALSALDVRDFIHDDGSTTNNVISTMAFIPKFVTSGWPQAALNGLNVGGFWIDVYKNSQPDATSIYRGSTSPDTPGAVAATSRSGVSVWDDISWISARIAASNRVINGRACHLVTPFERFAAMSWIMKSGNWGNVRGNNNNGKDTRDADAWGSYGIFDPLQAAYRTLAGSGPASWWSGGVIGQGIHGLVGNVYEWEDCRIESGLIQPKAYLAGATAAAATYIDYDDNAGGDAANIHQLTPGIYTITDATNGNENVTISRVIITGRFTGRAILSAGMATAHLDNCLMQLTTAVDLSDGGGGWAAIGALLEDATGKYMALPDKADTTTHAATLLDSWYKYDNSDSRALIRAGYWNLTTQARTGLVVYTYFTPVRVHFSVGFRAALSAGNQ